LVLSILGALARAILKDTGGASPRLDTASHHGVGCAAMGSIDFNLTTGSITSTALIVVAAYNWGGWDFGVTQCLHRKLQRR
jgi:hypothetical protein